MQVCRHLCIKHAATACRLYVWGGGGPDCGQTTNASSCDCMHKTHHLNHPAMTNMPWHGMHPKQASSGAVVMVWTACGCDPCTRLLTTLPSLHQGRGPILVKQSSFHGCTCTADYPHACTAAWMPRAVQPTPRPLEHAALGLRLVRIDTTPSAPQCTGTGRGCSLAPAPSVMQCKPGVTDTWSAY